MAWITQTHHDSHTTYNNIPTTIYLQFESITATTAANTVFYWDTEQDNPLTLGMLKEIAKLEKWTFHVDRKRLGQDGMLNIQCDGGSSGVAGITEVSTLYRLKNVGEYPTQD